MFKLRTFQDKAVLETTNHQRLDTAHAALQKRDGDVAVILGPTVTVWFKRVNGGWMTDRQLWHPEREVAAV